MTKAGAMPVGKAFRPLSVHTELGEGFYDPVEPAAFPKLTVRFRNERWAKRVGLDGLDEAEWLAHFGRFEPLPGSLDEPLALRYHGHQFRTYNPDLGDGRGFLFAQMEDLEDGRVLDLGTKGSGQTPYSRAGDGRLTLKGGVREILATEMLEALGVDTSKSFSLVETHESLHRGDEPSPTRSSVLVRLSHSHIRIGSFQRLAYHDEKEGIERLVAHCVRHYLPHAARDDPAEQALAFLEAVSERVAETGARWMHAGFVHGVLNSDNINITGESFDYGPWRFAPTCDPEFTAAYFDHTRLYAFARQPGTLLWNLTRLAECLLHLADKDRLEAVLGGFSAQYQSAFVASFLRRLGVRSRGPEADDGLVRAFWSFMEETGAPFEQAFFDWHGGQASEARAERNPSAEFYRSTTFNPVREALDGTEPANPDLADHSYFQRPVPCTMLIDEVEAIWEPIAENDDWSAFEAKLADIDELARAYGRA